MELTFTDKRSTTRVLRLISYLSFNCVQKKYDVSFFDCNRYSSIASMLGNAGQSGYAAGNYFMDSLAHYRYYLIAAQILF